jgi:hypothetical protein
LDIKRLVKNYLSCNFTLPYVFFVCTRTALFYMYLYNADSLRYRLWQLVLKSYHTSEEVLPCFIPLTIMAFYYHTFIQTRLIYCGKRMSITKITYIWSAFENNNPTSVIQSVLRLTYFEPLV